MATFCQPSEIVVANVRGLIDNGDFVYLGNEFTSQAGLFQGYDPNARTQGEVVILPNRGSYIAVEPQTSEN